VRFSVNWRQIFGKVEVKDRTVITFLAPFMWSDFIL
jgi:hypothetical protein